MTKDASDGLVEKLRHGDEDLTSIWRLRELAADRISADQERLANLERLHEKECRARNKAEAENAELRRRLEERG